MCAIVIALGSFAIMVAQIDPLSVARLLDSEKPRLSRQAQSILSAWSSFDDPVAVLAAVYIGAIIIPSNSQNEQSTNLNAYFLNLSLNIAITVTIYILNKIFKNFKIAKYLLLICTFVICIYLQLMLAIALTGLILRPKLNNILPKLVNVAFYTSLFILGMVLMASCREGLILGLAAICAQVLVGLLLTRQLPRMDRIHLALSQQNGITAIILALTFETVYPGTVSVIAPAVLFINLGHTSLNSLLDYAVTKYRLLFKETSNSRHNT